MKTIGLTSNVHDQFPETWAALSQAYATLGQASLAASENAQSPAEHRAQQYQHAMGCFVRAEAILTALEDARIISFGVIEDVQNN